MFITGVNSIEQALLKATSGASLYYSDPGKRALALIEEARKKKLTVRQVKPDVLDKMAPQDKHRGMVLEIPDESASCSVDLEDQITALAGNEKAFVVILDGVSDPHNLGAVLRSADVFGVDLIVLPEHGSVKINETVFRTSSGAAAHIPVATVTNLNRTIEKLKDAKFWIFGADASGTAVTDCDLKGRVALIMGSEGKGLHQLVSKNCDFIVSLPVLGKVDSLNVSVAAGVLMYEKRRQDSMK
jgi:23S rRNA (guanosine2251-2'-O)-methyltransferase